jgi:hypothetical protein
MKKRAKMRAFIMRGFRFAFLQGDFLVLAQKNKRKGKT